MKVVGFSVNLAQIALHADSGASRLQGTMLTWLFTSSVRRLKTVISEGVATRMPKLRFFQQHLFKRGQCLGKMQLEKWKLAHAADAACRKTTNLLATCLEIGQVTQVGFAKGYH